MPSLFNEETTPVPHLERLGMTRWNWTSDTNERLVAASLAGRIGRFARELVATLPRPRRLSRGIASLCRQCAASLAADDSDAIELLTRETLLAADRGGSRDEATNHVTALLDAADDAPQLPPLVLAAWLTLLPAIGRRLERHALVRLWQRTAEEMQRFAATSPPSEADPLTVDAELRDEILFRAGVVLSPLVDAAGWLAAARERWRGRVEHSPEEPLWPPLASGRWNDWFNILTRVTADAEAYDVKLWKKRHRSRLKSLAANAVAALHPEDARWDASADERTTPDGLQSFARLVGWERDSTPLRSLRALSRGTRSLRDEDDAGRPAFQSDAAHFAVLRNSWSPRATICRVHYAGRDVRLEVSLQGERFIQGIWSAAVSIDGQRLDAIRQWRCQCWFSDRDADFIELAADLGDGLSLMRQVLVSRQAGLLIFAEALRGATPDQQVALGSILPLHEGLTPEADGLTREFQVPFAGRRIRIFPAHLPWERVVSADGRFQYADEGLFSEIHGPTLRSQVILFDTASERGDEPADGGPLAVGENGRHVPPHDAVAARVRCGPRQWVYWHNLTAGTAPRTCLGHHTDSETVIGRFNPGGDWQLLVHVERDAAE